ncbi:winged helix-turn-helix domain-containing protein [Streptomyces sp. NPDC088358]|uniref:winged helix-turn-helix domain-containing protein n=1 Tax=Streptomyces sp. NPDC088358 TaxID=3365857 RepID=UPI0038043F0E
MLDAGPAAFGWSDQRWTPAGIAEIVRRRFGAEYTLAGLDLLLHRIGWSVRVPSRKAAERTRRRSPPGRTSSGPSQIEGGGFGCLALLRGRSRPGPGAAQGRTWGDRGHTPVVRVTARLSLTAYQLARTLPSSTPSRACGRT